ncbi:MAG: Flp family type IVb pilin [Firmicutes bacterium]|nr:Flp family type IVb pilin [Bacillota bacterium]
MKLLQKLWKDESGQGLVEYGLLIVLIIVIAVAALTVFGDSIAALFGGIDGQVTDAAGAVAGD